MAKFSISKNSTTLGKTLAGFIPAIKTPESMRKYGQMAADIIKLRTRLGSGVSSDGADKGPLKKLADSTKQKRQYLADKGKLSSDTSVGKSNLTESGQLLDSMKVISTEYGSAKIGPSGSRDDGKKNEDIGDYVTDAGRPFNNLAKVEIKRVQDAVKSDIRDAVKTLLTKGR